MDSVLYNDSSQWLVWTATICIIAALIYFDMRSYVDDESDEHENTCVALSKAHRRRSTENELQFLRLEVELARKHPSQAIGQGDPPRRWVKLRHAERMIFAQKAQFYIHILSPMRRDLSPKWREFDHKILVRQLNMPRHAVARPVEIEQRLKPQQRKNHKGKAQHKQIRLHRNVVAS